MNDKKLGRVNEEIRRVISDTILMELKDPRIDPMTTITEVKTTRDLKFSTIYVSVLGDENKEKETLKGLESAKGFLRRQVAEKIDLRCVPEIKIVIDRKMKINNEMAELIDKVIAEDRERWNGAN